MQSPPGEDSTTINADDVYWTMVWGKQYPTKPDTELMFEADEALARLLGEEVIFLNDHWWEESWPEDARKKTSLNVNCSDVFAWGCADGETIDYEDIKPLYDHWLKDRHWGAAKWCAIKRNQKPQLPVIKAMKSAGVWDDQMEALGKVQQEEVN
jgi:hypothetical protein